jgi:hypothetical protein
VRADTAVRPYAEFAKLSVRIHQENITTDIAIFTGGSIRHTAVIPIAGDQITNDVAMALRTAMDGAEAGKLRDGMDDVTTLSDPAHVVDGAVVPDEDDASEEPTVLAEPDPMCGPGWSEGTGPVS